MRIDTSNTQFFTLFSGVTNGELAALERLVASFRQYNQEGLLYVVDQHVGVQELVRSGSRIYFSTTGYLEGVTSDLDQARLERLFAENADILRRIQTDKQYPHGPLFDKTINAYRELPYAVIMDSDVEFLGNGFLPEIDSLVREMSEDDVVVAGHIVQRTPFELPSQHAGAGEKHFLHRFGDWLTQRYGLWIHHGQLPRIDSAFFWINGNLFTRLGMSFFNLRLNVLDTTLYGGANYKLLGDDGASVLYQAAAAGKTIVNVDIRRHVLHMGRGARAAEPAQATGPTFSRTVVDWPVILNPEWPPSGGIRMGSRPAAASRRNSPRVRRVKRFLGPMWKVFRNPPERRRWG